MRKFIDLTGQTFGKLTVLERVENDRHGNACWLCQCNCVDKNRVIVGSDKLRSGDTKSCGCYKSSRLITHGMSKTPEYMMWMGAKRRAAKQGMDFNITMADIRIPVKCPVLNIPIIKGAGGDRYNKPTLDRIDNTKGYTKDNIAVISWKANTLKSDLSVDQIKKLPAYASGELPPTEYQPASTPMPKTTVTI